MSTLTPGWSLSASTATAGQVKLSMASGTVPVPVSLGRISLNEGALPTQVYCDINRDGGVDVVDLLYFIDGFGLLEGDPGHELASDFNDDGGIDVIDLLIFVENFGM